MDLLETHNTQTDLKVQHNFLLFYCVFCSVLFCFALRTAQ